MTSRSLGKVVRVRRRQPSGRRRRELSAGFATAEFCELNRRGPVRAPRGATIGPNLRWPDAASLRAPNRAGYPDALDAKDAFAAASRDQCVYDGVVA